MFAEDNFADAYRPLNGALTIGQMFSFDIAVNFRNGNKGVDVFAADGSTQIFNFNVGSDDYLHNGSSISNNTYSADTEFSFKFTQTSATAGTYEITRSGTFSGTDSGTYTGAIGAFKFYNGNTDGGSENDLYFNNLSVVPEVSSYALFGVFLFVVGGGRFVRRFLFARSP